MYRIIINKVNENQQYNVVTIGEFDALHLGHQHLFTTLNNIAQTYNYRRVVITFEPLPIEYFSQIKQQLPVKRLSLLRDKVALLIKSKLIDEIIILRFSHIANLSPDDFIQNVLINKLHTAHVVVGADFKFGYNRTGTIQDFNRYQIKYTQVPPLFINNQCVSSSLIRQLALNNQLDLIKTNLGRNLCYTSRVIHGNQLGRKFGVPTINLSIGKHGLAVYGIYVAKVYIDNQQFNAVASIGTNPTVTDSCLYKLEAHLLDVDLDLYGKIATIELIHFLRAEHKFIDLPTLFMQIKQDILDTRHYF